MPYRMDLVDKKPLHEGACVLMVINCNFASEKWKHPGLFLSTNSSIVQNEVLTIYYIRRNPKSISDFAYGLEHIIIIITKRLFWRCNAPTYFLPHYKCMRGQKLHNQA